MKIRVPDSGEHVITTALCPTGPLSTAGALSQTLFDHDAAQVHEPWRRLVAGEAFRYRVGLSSAQRVHLAYDRLALLNAAVEDPLALAADPYRLASMHEWTAVVDSSLSTVSGIHYNLFLGSLLDHRAVERHDTADFVALRRTGTFLCTELEHGNDAGALRTTATFDRRAGGFVLHTPAVGAQKFMPNTSAAGGPKSAVVAARLMVDGEDHGIFLFLTPLTDMDGPLPGIRIRTLPERVGSPVDHCLTSFDRVRLPWSALLAGEPGGLTPESLLTGRAGSRRRRFLQAIGRVTTGQLCMSASGLGGARTALAVAVRYAHHRTVSGPRADERVPLAAHRSHHARLLNCLATAYAMTFLHRETLRQWAEHEPPRRERAERLVALAKAWITWQARDIVVECRERCGAQGLFPVNGIADFLPSVEGAITSEGDNLAVWVKAAAELVFDPRPDGVRDTGTPSLDDCGHLRNLLAAVESAWHRRARTRLRRGPHPDSLSRWNAAVNPALEAVAAHAAVQAADAFLAAVARVTHPEARRLLHDLCRLFLLGQVEQHTGSLLVDGRMTADQVWQLPDAMDNLTASLAPHMTTLVEAFAVPEEILGAIPVANAGYVDAFDDPEGPWQTPSGGLPALN
ncbi:acyl-CoA oxidase [Streptomyces griseocarneus]|nr:acyl-CoA oxidase [Streptomyces griseocarneus]